MPVSPSSASVCSNPRYRQRYPTDGDTFASASRNDAIAGLLRSLSGTSRPNVFAAPASLTTTPARKVFPSTMRTPTARPDSTTSSATSAECTSTPPAPSITGANAFAIAPAPPTGYQAPPR